ncbi:MAG TPA: MFS transporter [Archangium sp.]|uniref:MFS transporter n=1 Tax=Archangium sp. TaxID=1872627 RepID=UPI002E3052E8|nr:MFS transporter [Archangium sp.]HEX5752035.1 MFS transporter [Archangium sp.]
MAPDSTGAAPPASNAVLLVSARFVSDVGAFLNMVALSTYVYLQSRNAIMVGIFLACRVSGGIAASLMGTVFFRRFPGRAPLVVLDVIRAGAIGLLLLLPSELHVPVLPFIALALGLCNALFSIGLNSQLPGLVRQELLMRVNAWLTSMSSLGMVLGSLASGLLIALASYQAVFAINVLTYLVAGLLILPLRSEGSAAASRSSGGSSYLDEWRQLRVGLRALPVLASMLLVTLFDTLGSAAHNVGFPVLAKLIDAQGAARVMGFLLACWAVGKFAGARLASGLGRRAPRPEPWLERMFFAGVVMMSAGFILCFRQDGLPLLLTFAALAGLGDGLAEVALVSRAQRTSDELRLPIFSLLTLMQMVGFGIGMLISAPFFEWMHPAGVVALFHGLPLLAVAIIGLRLLMAGRRPKLGIEAS